MSEQTIISFTLPQLKIIMESKSYLTQERFNYYFEHLYNIDPAGLKKLWQVYQQIPWRVNSSLTDSDAETIAWLMPRAAEVATLISNGWDKSPRNIDTYQTDYRKVYYEQDGIVSNIEFNIYNGSEMIAYAAILQRCTRVLAMLKSFCNLQLTGSKTTNKDTPEKPVYEGDFFYIDDSYWGRDKGNIYMLNADGNFQRLLYMKGEGYLDADGDPNIDKKSKCSSYVVTASEHWHLMGNIIVDSHLLKDGPPKAKKTKPASSKQNQQSIGNG